MTHIGDWDLGHQSVLITQAFGCRNTKRGERKGILFWRHFIVRHAGKYYDPSYGTGYTGERDFEERAVSGYAMASVGGSLMTVSESDTDLKMVTGHDISCAENQGASLLFC